MAPLRRYLRITKYSVLEVRIYLDRPSDAETWLLRREDPALPRVIQAVRPLVLPKLREEFERVRARSGAKARKKGVKDVVVEDDFEVSIFLTDLSSRHSVMTKQKAAKERPRIQSNSGKLTGWLTTGTRDQPVDVTDKQGEPFILREEDDDEVIHLSDVPEAEPVPTSNKRSRSVAKENIISSDGDTSHSPSPEPVPSRKRTRRRDRRDSEADRGDDDKKLGLTTSYDGFSIYGRILCLIVKRKGPKTNAGGTAVAGSSQKMLENWVSTQAAAERVDDDDDNG